MYNTSVLATIPPSVSDLLTNEPNRLRTLFTVGVNDIPMLEELAQESQDIRNLETDQVNERGWVACTTDALLALKPHLYDLLITLPRQPLCLPGLKIHAGSNHPAIICSEGTRLNPTIRDLSRWKRLILELPLPRSAGPDPDFDDLIYERTWTEFICGGLFWWATAGEAAYGEDFFAEDSEDDYFLNEVTRSRRGTLGEGVPLLQRSDTLDSFMVSGSYASHARQRSDTLLSRTTVSGEADVGIMVYFHRMTARMLSSLSAVIDANELNEEAEGQSAATKVGVEDLMRMGLDWTEREFLREMCQIWFGRDIVFHKTRSDCCY